MKIILILLTTLLLFNFLNAQPKKDLKFINLSEEHGFPSTKDIIQDQQGFIWLATENGLYRYDSYVFKTYRKNNNDSTSLIDNLISVLFVDSDGMLWIGTHKGISVYNRDYDSFTSYLLENGKTESQSNHISCIAEDSEKQIYIGLQDGRIFTYNTKTKSFNKIKTLLKEIKHIFFDSEKLMWVLTDTIYLYDKNLELVKTIYNPEVKYAYNYMIEDDDKYWISTYGDGLFWYSKKNKTLIRSIKNSVYEDFISEIYKDSKNNIWIGCSNSLKLYDRKNNLFHYYYHFENIKHSLSSGGVYSFFEDHEGNYWVLTSKGDINISVVKKKFKNLNTDGEEGIWLNERVISSVLIDNDNNLWAGSYDANLDFVDLDQKNVIQYKNDPSDKKSLAIGSVLAVFEDSRNNIWVSTYRGGLQQFDSSSGKFIQFRPNKNKNSISSDDIRAVVEDKEGNLWFATGGMGLDKLEPQTNTFTNYRHDPNDIKTKLVNDWLFSIICDSNNCLWIGSSFGLSMLDANREIFTNYLHDPNNKNSLSNNFINCIYEDSKKNLWIGTNNGLNLFNRKDKKFKVYLEEEGMPNDVIKGILEDNHGNLWISTNKGISKFSPETEVFQNYELTGGVASNEFNRGACTKSKKGQLFFGSNNGVITFIPESIKNTTKVLPVYITGFKILNEKVLPGQKGSPLQKDIIQTKEITLNHEQATVFSFEFISLSFINSGRREYAYMMQGFDRKWIYSKSKREATYTNLDPGKYVFKVKACNHDGVWSEESTSVRITILPPWWETNLAIALYVVLIIALFLAFYFYRTTALRKQKETLEKLVSERTRELNAKATELHEAYTRLEEQSEEIKINSENTKEINKLLVENQDVILKQSQQLKENNQELLLLNATKDQFFSIIAHDIKNPFTSILGFSDLLSRRYKKLNEAKKIELIEIINQSSKKLFQLLENLLQWARSQTGQINFEPEDFSLNELVDSNISLVQNIADEKKLELKRGFDKSIKLFADQNMINTVIRNLVSNAIKFTKEGSIKIDAFQENGNTTIKVIDSGIGIESKKLDKIFEVMKYKSTQGTNGETGTGLGLILCKEFIQKHKGTISVESEPGKGTVFSFTIPDNFSE